MSIKQLRADVEAHFDTFEKVPLNAAWRRRDTRICLLWMLSCIIAISIALAGLPATVLTAWIPALLPVMAITLLCALHMSEVYAQLRAQRLGAAGHLSPSERLLLQQHWLCERYACQPAELLGIARQLRHAWEERKQLEKLASTDTMAPRFVAFFTLPDSARLIGLVAAVAAIIATLITLGGSIDNVFSALEDWRPLVFGIVLLTFLGAELVLLWIMASAMLRELGSTLLEQLGWLPLNPRRVYGYLLTLHIAHEPVTPTGRKMTTLIRAIALCFEPLPVVWGVVRGRLRGPVGGLGA
ncbi:hypothetical protein [Pseudomonas sp. NPDC007930]|uniref:hypothetical protein n=1 Tax=Pseudomonas sp. NPDC007930 TaxID=3364417 RepID=UPI0036EE2567